CSAWESSLSTRLF
nr:immunoglobulin light chain junction region [Macaca mulatta]